MPSITENCETLIEQTHKKAEETFEYEITQSREIFSFKPPISVEGLWMIRITSLEVYNSIFKIATENYMFEHYTDLVDEFSVAELEDELEEIPGISDFSTELLQDIKNRTA